MATVMQIVHQGGEAGSVTSALHLSLGLARAGWGVRFVCPPGSEVERLATRGGLVVRSLQLHASARRSNAACLAELIASEAVDLVNSQSARDREALTWLSLTRRLRVPFVVTRRQMPRTVFLENWFASRAAARVVAVSRAVAEALVRRGTPPRKLDVVHNGLVAARVDRQVTAGELDEWRVRTACDPQRRMVGVVSRRKDQYVVLQALSH